MGNNPVRNVDPLGDDWFVNNVDGGVIFVKNITVINQQVFDQNNFAENPKNYDRLGPDNMFGSDVTAGNYGQKVLDANFVNIENPTEFMNNQGYRPAEKVKIEEKQYTSGGSFGGEERITSTNTDLKQIGSPKQTYTRPENLNKRDNLTDKTVSGRYSSIRKVKYDLTKPKGQDNHKTAVISENRGWNVSGSQSSAVKEFVEFFRKLKK